MAGSESDMLRVLLVGQFTDAHRAAIQALPTQPGFEIAGEATASDALADLCFRLQPDIVIAGTDGNADMAAAWIDAVARTCPRARTVVLDQAPDVAPLDAPELAKTLRVIASGASRRYGHYL